jgi:predicted ester cyclase
MSTEDNKTLIRRLYDEVVSAGDLAAADALVAEAIINHNSGERGLALYKQHIAGIRTTFPDFRVTIEDLSAEGDKVVARVTGRGTHLGVWQGIVPTGKQVTITAINIERIVDGKLVEHWGEADALGELQQFGALPPIGREARRE